MSKGTSYNNINLIVDTLLNDFGKLMSDSYGNYFCQKHFKVISPDQRLSILNAISDNFVKISCDAMGTHSMQRLMEQVSEDEERMVIYNSIQHNVSHLAFHHKGNFVLLTIVSHVMKGPLGN